MRIFAGVPSEGAGRQTTVVLSTTTFLAISVATAETLERRSALSAVCRQGSTRKPCYGREIARCRCKIRYVSKFIATMRGSPCDSTVFLLSDVITG